jgi:hypothetical protein
VPTDDKDAAERVTLWMRKLLKIAAALGRKMESITPQNLATKYGLGKLWSFMSEGTWDEVVDPFAKSPWRDGFGDF